MKIERILDKFNAHSCRNPEYTVKGNLINVLNHDATCGLLVEHSIEVEDILKKMEFVKSEDGINLKEVIDSERLVKIRDVDLRKLKKFLTFSKQFDDAVRLSFNGCNLYGLAFGDMKEIAKVALGLKDGDALSKKFSSRYAIEYVEDLIRALDKEDCVDFLLAKDFPLIAVVNGKVAYVVAPRIEEI